MNRPAWWTPAHDRIVLYGTFPPYPVGNPGQFRRLQRDLGLPRNTQDMFSALQRRLVGRKDLATIHEWLAIPTGRYHRNEKFGDARIYKRGSEENKLSFASRHLKIASRYSLRRTTQRKALHNAEVLSKSSNFETEPDGNLQFIRRYKSDGAAGRRHPMRSPVDLHWGKGLPREPPVDEFGLKAGESLAEMNRKIFAVMRATSGGGEARTAPATSLKRRVTEL